MRTAELVVLRGGRIQQSHGCPDHLTVGALERCARCMQILFVQLDRLRDLDAAGAVPPIPHGDE